nr:VP16 f activation domain [Gateway binary vector pGWB470]AGO05982.1 VP16 f activation domain [Gateway binary vector pGWB570]AGO05986.1 VP16 f activation domain [Gateway binary vector pGWB670]AGO05990.1 VP16 f activation domain [Gateway binary vector pGWB770]
MAPPTDVSLGDELHLDGEDVAMAHADALDDFDLDMLGDGDSPGPGFTPHDSAPYGALDMADFEFEQMFTDALGIDEYGGEFPKLKVAPPTDVSLGDELHLDGEDVAMAHADALDDFDLDMLGDGDSPGPGFTPHDSAPYGALDMADFEFEQMFTDALGIDEYGG